MATKTSSPSGFVLIRPCLSPLPFPSAPPCQRGLKLMIINEIIAILHLIIAAVITLGGIVIFHPVTSPLQPPTPPPPQLQQLLLALPLLLLLLPGTMVSGPFMLDLDNLIQLWGVQHPHRSSILW